MLCIVGAIIFSAIQFLVPANNPTHINCLLPQHYREKLNPDGSYGYTEADIVKVFFAPTELRTQLMWFQTVIYGVLLLFGMKSLKAYTEKMIMSQRITNLLLFNTNEESN